MARTASRAVAATRTTNPSHLVLSTPDPHPPFIQEIAPGQVEYCAWDTTINGYRCRAMTNPHDAVAEK